MSLFAQCFQFAMLFVLLLAFSFLCWWFSQSAFWRGRWAGEKDEIIPDAAPRLALRWRALQAAAIAAVGLSALCFIGSGGDGPFTHFGAMYPAKSLIVAAVTAITAFLILLGAFFALAGGTGWGCWLAALALFVFGALNAGPWSLLDRLCPGDSAEPQAIYDFQVSDNLPGVEIWVNNVFLGKTPLRISREEFLEKVPYQTYIPGVITLKQFGPGYHPTETDPTWNHFSLPEPTQWKLEARMASPARQLDYFARTRLNGEWGKSTGGSGSGGGGGRYALNYTVNLGFKFPKLEAQINSLLDQARAPGFRPTPEWFKTLDALNPSAWRIINERAAHDPQMLTLRDAWAAWRYGLDRATTPDTAWQALEAIAREAETNREFDTDSLAGQAVALLDPRLDLDRLAGEAAHLLRKYRMANWNYSWTRTTTPLDFSCRIEPGEGGANAVPMRAYVIAEAAIVAGERIKAKTGVYPPLFQTQLAPELVRSAVGNESRLTLAAACGGPEVETYLLRQPWRQPPGPHDFENMTYVYGTYVNKWLKLLAGMDNDIGHRFRAAHRQEVLDLARQIMGNNSPPWVTFDSLSFLFLDPQLALEFWPAFKGKVIASSSVADNECTWKYLVRTEPATTLEMYQESWRELMGDQSRLSFYYPVFTELDRLPAKRRREVLTVIQGEIQKTLSDMDPARRKRDPRAMQLNQILDTIQGKLNGLQKD